LRLARAPEGGFSVVLSLPVGAARSNRQSMALGN
jgi:hypothetical protein